METGDRMPKSQNCREMSEIRVNERRIVCKFGRDDVRRLVAEAAAEAAGVDLDDFGVDFDVKFEERIEGTLAYRGGSAAEVTITVDLTAGVADPAPNLPG
ncbi:MAG TPA: hypothetical protein VNX29_05360 [Kaistia sp.]|nr:hypothetical protein [Kaistia sp.]